MQPLHYQNNTTILRNLRQRRFPAILLRLCLLGLFAALWSGPALGQSNTVLYGFFVTSASVLGGQNTIGELKVGGYGNGPGHTSPPITITLTSSNPAVAQVPASVVAAGNPSGYPFGFTITTQAVLLATPVTLTAAAGLHTFSQTLTVRPPGVSGLALNPARVFAATSCSGTVTLLGPAPSGGATVTFSSPTPSLVILPTSVNVPAGQTTATFPVTAGNVTVLTSVIVAASAYGIAQSATLVIQPHLFNSDFDGDGHNDLVLQNSRTGLVSAWSMDGMNVQGTAVIDIIPIAGWNVVGTADFNNDGHTDLVYQNATTGQVMLRYFNGTTLLGGEVTSLTPDADYQVVAINDFNNDGNVDLVFQSKTTRAIVIWFMNGANVIGGIALPYVPANGFQVVGAGDFNGDGQPDLLFQNATTGQLVVWYMQGTTCAGGGAITGSPEAGWQVKGVADYNNDGMPDLVFQNRATNQVVLWFLNGLTVTGGGLLSAQPSPPNVIVGPR